MNRRRLLTILAAASAMLLLTIGLTSSYLTDVEGKENVITIGKVSISLDEGSFEPEKTYPVVPGSIVEKAPKLTNDGNKDEFAFMRITVPKAQITLLQESGGDKGKPNDTFSGEQEYFRLLTNETDPLAAAVKDSLSVLPTENNTLTTENTDIDLKYHSGDASTDGWVLLKAATKSKTEDGKTVTWDEYVFGYNKKLFSGAETCTLFDTVQLKSFIDGEVKGETSIGVYCYGIQADNLRSTTITDFDKERFDLNDLNSIYTIVSNKAGLT